MVMDVGRNFSRGGLQRMVHQHFFFKIWVGEVCAQPRFWWLQWSKCKKMLQPGAGHGHPLSMAAYVYADG